MEGFQFVSRITLCKPERGHPHPWAVTAPTGISLITMIERTSFNPQGPERTALKKPSQHICLHYFNFSPFLSVCSSTEETKQHDIDWYCKHNFSVLLAPNNLLGYVVVGFFSSTKWKYNKFKALFCEILTFIVIWDYINYQVEITYVLSHLIMNIWVPHGFDRDHQWTKTASRWTRNILDRSGITFCRSW